MPQGFAVGMRVRHPRYGAGRVVEISGYSRHRVLHVLFDGESEPRTMVADKCPLQPIGVR